VRKRKLFTGYSPIQPIHSALFFSRSNPLQSIMILILDRKIRLVLALLTLSTMLHAESFPEIYNSEDPSHVPLSPGEALRQFHVPAGYQVTLFAAEPDVQQPVAMTFDARGRLWVAENYTYAERAIGFERKLRDRIIILEDTNNDGTMDRRTVFWDHGQLLASVEVGFGGVFALCAPHLLFIPDRDGDDVPDGEPEILLTGWNDDVVRHNLVNGLKWGPDGWLYGRHGIQATSLVGTLDTPLEQRQKINCGIWRYHPVRKAFEVVAQGTTNPWGMDWDDHGEPFFINTVIGHLWHLIPGANYRRMYGEPLDPHVYTLIDQHADHYHWDTREAWDDIRQLGVTSTTLEAGGGHAHSGLMIYLGDNWSDTHRGRLFTINFHGRRLNQEILERHGSGYIGRHGPDEFLSDDPWFRGIELIYGPDGGVYVADWSDTGECHEDDGVHRSSGRIYKITLGQPTLPTIGDLAQSDDMELVRLQLHRNDWFVRQARRLLQERAAKGQNLDEVRGALRRQFEEEPDVSRKLRALWALHAIGAADSGWLLTLLDDPNEHIRAWAIRLLTDSLPIGNQSRPLAASTFEGLLPRANIEPSALVRLVLSSTLQRLPIQQRADLARPLLARSEDVDDHNLPLMHWYGIKAIADAEPDLAVDLASIIQPRITRRLLARRLTEEIEIRPDLVNRLLLLAAGRDASNELRLDLVEGLFDTLRGWRMAPKPEAWNQFTAVLEEESNEDLEPDGSKIHSQLRDRVRELSALFGDGRALDEIQSVALDPEATLAARRAALRTLIENRAPGLRPLAEQLFSVPQLAGLAAQGLALFDDPLLGQDVAAGYWQASEDQRPELLAALASRPSFAHALLDRISAGPNQIPRSHLSAFHVRQMRAFQDATLNRRLAEVWGEIRPTDQDSRQTVARHQAELTPDRLAEADLRHGRALFDLACAPCHRLYDSGGAVGPDLTGSGRHNLEYLLEKLVDPNALVAADYRVSILTLTDGRVLNGIVGEQTTRTLTLKTMTETFTIDRQDIIEIEPTSLSIMPEGLLDAMDPQQARDLIAYIMSPRQVPLPDPNPYSANAPVTD
jgi:putative membrane-bound dehydrogenase-like protein